MALRIKELCKEKHITMSEVASRIGINPITLSQSLNGNPTLSRLQEVADVLGVGVGELFDTPIHHSIKRCLFVNEKPFLVNNEDEVQKVLDVYKKGLE